MTQDDWELGRRDTLPEALRALVDHCPRATWDAHPRFPGLAAFWLDKHLGFRRLSDLLIRDLRAHLDGRLAPEGLAARVSRTGGMLIGGLHDHHGIEDHHYFPAMLGLEPGMARGFDLLDRDHHALDPWLARLTEEANALIRAPDREAAGRLLGSLDAFAPFLARHLEDEEDLVVPVILRHAMG